MDRIKTAIITGATSGIGYATAHELAKLGYHLILTGRRQDRLRNIKQELEQLYPISCNTLCFDIRIMDEVNKAFEMIDQKNIFIDVLVNNAGLALGSNTIDQGLLEDWEVMIDTNIKGLLYVSKRIIPRMKSQLQGHILNIGSIAGKETYKNGNVYCATKHAVDALTKSMRIDLLPYKIKVTGICPGATDTEFSLVRYKGDQAKADAVYNGYTPLSAKDIAEVIAFAVTRPAHVTLNDVLIMPTAQANTSHYHKEL